MQRNGLKKWNLKLEKVDILKFMNLKKGTLDELIDKYTNESRLDGCYVIKTDLKKEEAETQIIHSRYKDLSFVESAFRTSKSNLERPIYVRSEMSTYGHVLVVMLAYIITKELDKSWSKLYLTVDEGLRSLSTLAMQEITV